VLYRRWPRAGRPVHFEAAGAPYKRRMPAPPPFKSLMGNAIHVPLLCRGLSGDQPPFTLVMSSTHLTLMDRGALQSSNKRASTFAAYLGRDLMRLPAKHDGLMILGGDFNTGGDGKRSRACGAASLYAELTTALNRPHDSEDEWEEDSSIRDETLRWPPPPSRPLARDLLRERHLRAKDFGGLQRGSTCMSWVDMQGVNGRQGVRARAIRERWPDDHNPTDEVSTRSCSLAHKCPWHTRPSPTVRALARVCV
jgi:hypothetical protein